MKVKVKFAQSCPALWDPTDYTVRGILQARILEWVASPSSSGSTWARNLTGISCLQAASLATELQGSLTSITSVPPRFFVKIIDKWHFYEPRAVHVDETCVLCVHVHHHHPEPWSWHPPPALWGLLPGPLAPAGSLLTVFFWGATKYWPGSI